MSYGGEIEENRERKEVGRERERKVREEVGWGGGGGLLSFFSFAFCLHCYILLDTK